VLTETFDSGLLGEHVLSTLDDAWMRLINTHCQVAVSPSVCLSVCEVGVSHSSHASQQS